MGNSNPTANRAAFKKWYDKNSAKKIAKSRAVSVSIRDMIRAAKEDVPCTDCGTRYPYYVMHFDHLGDKLFNVSRGWNRKGMNVVKREMAKCEVVCANCHAIRTQSRLPTVAQRQRRCV